MFKKVHMFRVRPRQELYAEVSRYCREHDIRSGIIIGIVGSAEKAHISFLEELPAKYVAIELTGPLEIVAAQGSVALKDGETFLHIHIHFSRRDACWGGHLVDATVFSSAEVTIGELDYQLRRQLDSYTGNNELLENS